MEDPEETNADWMRRIEYHVLEELTMEQAQTGLPKELQTRIEAKGPKNTEELQQCIREYQLQHQKVQTERRPPFPRRTESHNDKKFTGRQEKTETKSNSTSREERTCFRCGKTGHFT